MLRVRCNLTISSVCSLYSIVEEQHGLLVDHIDAKTAFHNAPVEGDWVLHAPGHDPVTGVQLALILHNSTYEICQSPRN